MGWFPRLHFDRRRGFYYTRCGGYRYLGKDARAAREKFAALVRGLPSAADAMVVSEMVEGWIRTNAPGSWLEWLARLYEEFAGAEAVAALPADHMDGFVRWLRRAGYAAQTWRHAVAVARRIHGGKLKAPDWKRYPKPRRAPRDVPPDQLALVIASLREQAAPIVRFILATGCRPDEACRLTWADVDLERGECRLTEHKTGDKTGTDRTIYLTPAAREVVDQLRQNRGVANRKSGVAQELSESTGREHVDGHVSPLRQPDSALREQNVFRSRLGTPYTPAGLRSILRRRGLTGAYQLRHTLAQAALDSGVRMEDVAKLLGHSDLRMVQVYAQVRSQRARTVAANLAAPAPPQPDAAARRAAWVALQAARDKRRQNPRRSKGGSGG